MGRVLGLIWRSAWRALMISSKTFDFPIPLGIVVYAILLVAGVAASEGEKVFRFYIPVQGPFMPLELTFAQTVAGALALVVFIGAALWNSAQDQVKSEAEIDSLKDKRADLEIRFESKPPYQLRSRQFYRIGICNQGPGPARNVRVQVISLNPNPLHEGVLPSSLIGEGNFQQGSTINPRQEVNLKVLGFLMRHYGGKGYLSVGLWVVAELYAEFKPSRSQDYRLRINVTWENPYGDLCRDRDFIIRRKGNDVLFYPADGATSA